MRSRCLLCRLIQPRLSPFRAGGILLLVHISLTFALTAAQITTAPVMEPSTGLSTNGRFGQNQLDGQLRTAEQISKVRARAEAGSARDQFLMGYACSKGLGQAQNLSQALAWYLTAATRAEPAAITELGRL